MYLITLRRKMKNAITLLITNPNLTSGVLANRVIVIFNYFFCQF